MNFYGNHIAGNLGTCKTCGKRISEDLLFLCGLVCLSVTKSRQTRLLKCFAKSFLNFMEGYIKYTRVSFHAKHRPMFISE